MEETPTISFWILHEDLGSLLGPLQGSSGVASSCCRAALAFFSLWPESADMASTPSEWMRDPLLS